MDKQMFEVRCSQERRSIGKVNLPKGGDITADQFTLHYKADAPEYAMRDDDGKRRVRDGEQALCPRCKGPLLLCEPGKPDKGVYLVPGSGFRVAA